MSRLDSFIRRLEAQRTGLDYAARLIEAVPGCVFELGLGNGRTYDHLRERLGDREIFVFEREPLPHPACLPPPDRLVVGDVRETLREAGPRFAGQVALVHVDVANGNEMESIALARSLVPVLAPLLAPGGVVVSEPALALPEWRDVSCAAGLEPARYHVYRNAAQPAAAPARGAPVSSS